MTKVKVIRVTAEVEIPRPPNYLHQENGHKIPLSAITESGLLEIGKLWTEALIERAKEQQNSNAE